MPSLIEELASLRETARVDVKAAATENDLEGLRVKYLGKKGSLSAVLAGMRNVSAAERPAIGAAANEARDEVEALLTGAKDHLAQAKLAAELGASPLDVTLPGRRGRLGRRHPLSRTFDDMIDVFRRLGFSLVDGPHIELDYYNFEALNFPADHPARDMQDTFFIDGATLGAAGAREDVLLRTHTSPMQIRAMLTRQPPVRVIAAGSVFRCDSDQTHSPMFHQIECLFVDKGVSFADLKGTLDSFVRSMFGANARTRFRPSFFPFVEPGAEVDISCTICGGVGRLASGEPCRTCKSTGWLEVLGAGLVHPNVLRGCHIDPDVYTGFAFGLGVERMAMLRYGIDDLRHLFENDARFLEQF
jgi:phenylalanyl-tRNA synthetase alpha chain